MTDIQNQITIRLSIHKNDLLAFCEHLKTSNIGYYLYPNKQKNNDFIKLYLNIELSELYKLSKHCSPFEYKEFHGVDFD